MARNKRLICGLALLMSVQAAVPFQPQATAAETTAAAAAALPLKLITVDPSYQQPKFQGFGTALAWFGNITGGWPEAKKNELADALYGKDGLNFNIVRYNIGGEDAPETVPYMRKGGAVPGYWNRPADVAAGTNDWWNPNNPNHWNWEKDKNQQWWVLAAKARGATQFEAFSNSPPYFMTNSGYVSGNTNASTDNLRSDQYENFATYLAEVVKYFKNSLGVEFQTLSPVNEPNTNYWGKGGRQEGSHWDPASQAKMMRTARAALDARGLSTAVSAMDESVLDTFVTDWDAYDTATRASIGQLNTHTYGGSKRTSVRDIAKGAGKPLWMSEVDMGPYPQNFDDIRPGLALAKQITTDIRQLEPNAWVTWQAIEDGVNMDAQHENANWGLIHVDFAPSDPSTVQVHYNKKYYAMGNYSKFIQPGYRVVNSSDGDTLAAIDPNGDEAVIVYRNESTGAAELDIDLNGFGVISSGAQAVPHVTSATENLAQKDSIAIQEGKLHAVVQPESVNTFVVSGVTGVNPKRVQLGSSREFHLLNKNSGKALELAAATGQDPNAVVQQTNDAAKAGQVWTIQKLTDGYTSTEAYKIVHKETGKVLGMINGVGAAEEWSGAASQQWIISSYGSGDYTFINKASGLLMEIGGFSTANGTKAGTYRANGGTNQIWQLTRSAAIESLKPIERVTSLQVAPSLPSTVIGTYDDGSRKEVNVTWSPFPADKLAQEGSFEIQGTVSGTDAIAIARITVSAAARLEPVILKTLINQPPALPNQVPVVYKNGTVGSITINWNSIDPDLYKHLGKFQVKGTAAGTALQAVAKVQVADRASGNVALAVQGQTYPSPIASFTSAYDQLAHLNDGIVSLNDSPKNRWTNWASGSVRSSDWAGINFGVERVISSVQMSFYTDGGCSAPASFVLERWDGANWVAIPGTAKSGTDVALTTSVSFNELTTTQIRANMVSTGTKCIAVTEMQVNGSLPVSGSDATADQITIGGERIEAFSPDVHSYTIKLPAERTSVPAVGVSTTDLFATYRIQLPDSIPGTGTVTVTSEDGRQTSQYTLNFTNEDPAPTTPGAIWKGPSNASSKESFDLIYGLKDVEQEVIAQDTTIQYDADRLEFIGAASIDETNFKVVDSKASAGEIRLLSVHMGSLQAAPNGELMKLTFKVKDGAAAGQAEIRVSQLIAADREGNETTLQGAVHHVGIEPVEVDLSVLQALVAEAQQVHDAAVEGNRIGQYPSGSKAALLAAIQAAETLANDPQATQAQVAQAAETLSLALQTFKQSVITRVPGDNNNDNQITVGDLGILAKAFGMTNQDAGWDAVKSSDYNNDGKIDIIDLSTLARMILNW